jgi:hypothetical protein
METELTRNPRDRQKKGDVPILAMDQLCFADERLISQHLSAPDPRSHGR